MPYFIVMLMMGYLVKMLRDLIPKEFTSTHSFFITAVSIFAIVGVLASKWIETRHIQRLHEITALEDRHREDNRLTRSMLWGLAALLLFMIFSR